MEQTLARLLREEMTLKHLSTRDVAREAGVAHTTVGRILQGRSVSVGTLENVARYLKTDPAGFLAAGEYDGEDLLNVIVALVQKEPALERVFKKAAAKVVNGEIGPEVLREIVRYAAWRMDDISGAADDGSERNRNTANSNTSGVPSNLPGGRPSAG